MWCASRRPPLGVRLFLSLFAVSRRFSLRPSCHLAVAPFSSFFPLSLLLLSRRSPLLRSAAPPPPAGPLFSRLLCLNRVVRLANLHLEHLECGHQPHAQDRGAEKRTQLAGRSASGYGLESPSPGGARSQGHKTSPRDSSVYRVSP